MEINVLGFIEVLNKFRYHLDMLLTACREYMEENKDFLSTLDGNGIDEYMSSFLNKKLRDEGLEASPEEITYLSLGISVELSKKGLENDIGQ